MTVVGRRWGETATADVVDRVGPIGGMERIAALDILRGFALLGILVVNVELFRGADLYRMLAGIEPARTSADEAAQFVIGWLAGGKFLSSFALLFGVGAALMVRRTDAAGRSARRLLGRRYAWLLLFGMVHMLLLFPGDILFVYGLAGLLLLLFIRLEPRRAAASAAVLGGCYLAVVLAFTVVSGVEPPADSGFVEGFEAFFSERTDATVAAYTAGRPAAELAARAWEALIIQGAQLFELPLVLALFLIGYAIGASGLLNDPVGSVPKLRRVVGFALPVGLVLNLPIGFEGALGAVPAGPPADQSLLLVGAVPVAQVLGAPLLSVGYLAGVALLCTRPGTARLLAPLGAAGRMALTGYVVQSLLCAAYFVWFGNYDRLSTAAALPVVLVVWALLIAGCTAWLRRFDRGPLEHVWRRLTYGRSSTGRAVGV